MKKVKVMLSAMLVLAVVAGALAFKAKAKVIPVCLYTTTFTAPIGGVATTQCSLQPLTNAITFVPTSTTTKFITTLDPAFPCPQTTQCPRATTVLE